MKVNKFQCPLMMARHVMKPSTLREEGQKKDSNEREEEERKIKVEEKKIKIKAEKKRSESSLVKQN